MGIGIYQNSDANTISVANRIKKKIKQIEPSLPDGTKLEVSFDRSNYISSAIKEVYKTLFVALILVSFIIYSFLGNFRSLIVPLVALPVSLISTFLAIYFFDFSINLFTLMALVLAIGIVVDDAIVMLENIVRRIELGESPLVAAYKGSKQVSFAIIATTLILVAVFLPLIFIKGISGTLFRETAIALSFSIVVSSFVALTLSPMLGSKFLSKKERKGFFVKKFNNAFKSFSDGYVETLSYWLNKKKTISLFIILIVAGSIYLFNFTKKELIPTEDRGSYLIIGSTDEGSSFEYTQEKAQIIESRLLKLLEAEDSPYERLIMRVPGFGRSATSYNTFIIIALLDEWKNREKGSQTVLREAIGQIVSVPETFAFPISPQSIRVSSYNKPVQMVIYGNSYEELEEIQTQIIRKIRSNKKVITQKINQR